MGMEGLDWGLTEPDRNLPEVVLDLKHSALLTSHSETMIPCSLCECFSISKL
jgi:hypothetical protein